MNGRLAVAWMAALALVALSAMSQGCVLDADFPEAPTVEEQIEQQAAEEIWAGLFYDPQPGSSETIGLLAIARFNSDGQASVSFDHTYTGSWKVSIHREIVVTIEEVEERQGADSSPLDEGEQLVFLPRLIQKGATAGFEQLEYQAELPNGQGASFRTTIEMRSASSSDVTLADIDGYWRSHSPHTVGQEQVRLAMRFRAAEQQGSYGVLVEGTFVEWVVGRAIVFPCGELSCWGIYQAERVAPEQVESVASFGGHIIEQRNELRVYVPWFGETRILDDLASPL